MQRGSNPIGPRQDDQRKHELQGYLKSGQSTHAEDFHDPEPPADDDPAAGSAHGSLQTEIARHLGRAAFPTDTAGLLSALEEAHAPGELVDNLRRLPQDGRYKTAADVSRALGESAA
ncbi:DUF2795 domain-containing protein [Kitasatospora purpeofusca]|uniref:DUF2795 domain-containing protein n=1 Tax=Kitasatospora purpeofusca TaxID=67352 RepID=UPI002A5AEDB6|nr:DUF2795 domain-containing protein [Kitasatospora purpeofusca]MDY0812700.1 DUF2795 domain-containing protein [Kitasatospora purpeofusca]